MRKSFSESMLMSLCSIFIGLAGQCLAERAGSLQEDEEAISALIAAKQFDAAQTAVAKMKSDFAGEANLPAALTPEPQNLSGLTSDVKNKRLT